MDKNDFDIDFDFENEDGFDPEDFLSSDNPGDFDLSQFGVDDLDLDMEQEAPAEQAAAEEESFDYALEDGEDMDAFLDEDFTADIDFSARKPIPEEPEFAPEGDAFEDEDEAFDEAAEEDEGEEVQEKKRRKSGIKVPAIKLPKIKLPPKSDKPTIFSKFIKLYFGPLTDKNYGQEPPREDGRRRRRPSRAQIIKEVYLPPIILCLSVLLVLAMAVGSVSNAVKLKRINDDRKKQESEAAAQAADQAEQEYKVLMDQAEKLAIGYDYQGAYDLLKDYHVDDALLQQELDNKKAAYLQTQESMQEWKDVNAIANLSFHVLIHDPQRAFADKEYGGQYNRNFVTTGEFSKILDQLYSGGYVLVDFNSFVSSNTGLDGNKSFFVNPILLPQGKKPIMITETMVNYFAYMVDSNKDGDPDAGGAGFANKLVVTQSGDIKAQYVDASGQTLTGDYDLVPILEEFIKAHPDFSYRGARATLAVTGTEGVFGYRTNTSYISAKGQEFYEMECAQAKVLVDALREKGYTIACYTYNNENYRNLSVAQIKTDIQNWSSQIVPIVGDVDTMVFARESDIDDYSGNKFSVLYDAGFRFFVGKAAAPKADINNTFIHQLRLMVTGNAMGWSSSQFTGYFDCNVVVDLASRGNIPN